MNSPLMETLSAIMVVTSFALMGSGGTYIVLRLVENKLRGKMFRYNFFGSILFAIVALVAVPHLLILLFLPCIPVAYAGSIFHMRSGGKSRCQPEAFFLLLFAAYISITVQIALLWFNIQPKMGVTSWVRIFPFLDFILFYGYIIAPVAVLPLMMSLWKNSKLRPGVDKPLKEADDLR